MSVSGRQRIMAAGVLVVATAGCISGSPGPATRPAAPPQLDDKTVVLFDGTSWAGWVQRDGRPSQWVVQDDGSVLARGGDAITTTSFLDFQLHLEFFCPATEGKEGQAKSNSGVYLHGRYEVQVLDSWGQEPSGGSCGAIYSIAPPLVNASRPPGQWQSYDILFRAPRYDEVDALVDHPRVTVLHNGVVIHNNLTLPHATPGGVGGEFMHTMGPILLQFHGDPVRYRNIWARRLR
ncbi:MAG: 3-keto-disaccharide hydrolase [Planctomycetota bacterium]|jgi:hypothetical protein